MRNIRKFRFPNEDLILSLLSYLFFQSNLLLMVLLSKIFFQKYDIFAIEPNENLD